MKLNKLSAIFALFLVFGLFMSSCNDTTNNPTDPVVKYPKAPTNIQATSIDKETVSLKWTASVSETETDFKDYILYIDGVKQVTPIAKGVTTFTQNELDKEKEYTFAIRARYNNDTVSTDKAEIKWAPANRFVNNINDEPIKVYITASDLGSGLDIFDATGLAPKALKVANIANWTFGIDTRTANVLKFGPASSLSYTPSGSLRTVDLCPVPEYAADLSELYDSEALNKISRTFGANFVNLNSLTTQVPAGKHPIFILRETRADGYAKVLVKYVGGSFLQGTGDNQYIECVVSYQATPNLPYAK